MKRVSFFLCGFIGVHIIGIFIHIQRYVSWMQLSYEKQKSEKIYQDLCDQRQYLIQKFHYLKSYESVAAFAKKEQMKPLLVSHIRTLPHDK
ncbi:MAG TPA: hypothetical protein VEK38_04545 [Candidatus Bathyarchaeia archaeon]|nr:hypothetical protein [Candidatus Bathyarchaeia archaeon]